MLKLVLFRHHSEKFAFFAAGRFQAAENFGTGAFRKPRRGTL